MSQQYNGGMLPVGVKESAVEESLFMESVTMKGYQKGSKNTMEMPRSFLTFVTSGNRSSARASLSMQEQARQLSVTCLRTLLITNNSTTELVTLLPGV